MLFLSNLLFLENLHLPANIMCPCDNINNFLFEIFPVTRGIEHIRGTSKKSRCTVYFHQAVCNCLKGFADMSSTIVIQKFTCVNIVDVIKSSLPNTILFGFVWILFGFVWILSLIAISVSELFLIAILVLKKVDIVEIIRTPSRFFVV